MVFATSFAVLLSLNPYKHEPPVCPTDVAIDVDVDADGDQLRLFGVVLGVNTTKTTDPEPLELRAPAPIEPTDVRRATTELSGQVSSVGGTPQWAVISFDTFDMEGPIDVPSDGSPITVTLGDATLTAYLLDPTLKSTSVVATVEHANTLASKVTFLTDTDGDGAFDSEAISLPTRQELAAHIQVCSDDLADGDTATADIDINGSGQQLETTVKGEIARLSAVTIKADGTVKIEALEASPGDVQLAVFTHSDADGNLLSEVELPVVGADVAFSSGWLGQDALTTYSSNKLVRAARRGIDGVYDALQADGAWLDARLLYGPVLVTVDGGEAAFTASPLGDAAWNDTLLSPEVDHLDVELFDPSGRPVTQGPVRLDRSYLATRLAGGLGSAYSFDEGHALDVSLFGEGTQFVFGQTIYFRVDQFGEILIDGVVWEVE